MRFLSRLFGAPNTIIKDPQLGKLRYLESAHGHVWAGVFRAPGDDISIDFFIDTEVKLLHDRSRNIVVNVFQNLATVRRAIQDYFVKNHPLKYPDVYTFYILHVPGREASYDAELICRTPETDFSVILEDLNVVEIITHEN